MTPLEQYLHAATRGLWGKKKLEVREELEAHVLEKAHRHELIGMAREDAITKVLADIGPANIVSRGMIGVHTMPNAFRSTLLIASLCIGVIATIPSSIAQVTTISGFLTERNYVDYIWLNLTSLSNTLKQTGVASKTEKNGYRLTFPEGGTAFVQATSTRNEQGYLSAMEFIHALENTNLDISLSGYDNPEISIGKTKITLGTTTSPVKGNLFYAKPMLEIAEMHVQNFGLLEFSFPTIVCCKESENTVVTIPTTKQHVIKANVVPGQVYGMLTAIQPGNTFQKGVRFGIAHSKNAGELVITTSEINLEFVGSIEDIYNPYPPKHTKAVLIELTGLYKRFGGLKATNLRVLLPENRRSEAIK